MMQMLDPVQILQAAVQKYQHVSDVRQFLEFTWGSLFLAKSHHNFSEIVYENLRYSTYYVLDSTLVVPSLTN